MPALPGTSLVPRDRKPSGPSLRGGWRVNKVVLETGDPDPPVVEGDEDDVVDHPELGSEPARRPRAPHEGATVQPHCGSYSYNKVKFPSRQVL